MIKIYLDYISSTDIFQVFLEILILIGIFPFLRNRMNRIKKYLTLRKYIYGILFSLIPSFIFFVLFLILLPPNSIQIFLIMIFFTIDIITICALPLAFTFLFFEKISPLARLLITYFSALVYCVLRQGVLMGMGIEILSQYKRFLSTAFFVQVVMVIFYIGAGIPIFFKRRSFPGR